MTIRVAWGAGSGPTETAAYDAALAAANLHNYNLVTVSSVIPADADVAAVGTAPDLGPAGNQLTVVQARAGTEGSSPVSAALAWAKRDDGPGLFYEAGAETDADDVAARVRTGLDAGMALRDWTPGDVSVRTASASGNPGEYTAAVVVAAFGESAPVR